jgi:AcrR family transcriptional regulator
MSRTPSTAAHQRVLDATLSLFATRGIDATSVDAIARTSGVSKATIYKHWTDKDALALEALSAAFGLRDEPPAFDSGDLRQDFVNALTYQPAKPSQEIKDRLMPHVMAYAARHREFGAEWRERAIEPPQRRLLALIRRAVRRRTIRTGIDQKAALALLLGPMLYWHIFIGRKPAGPMPRHLAEQVVDAFFRAFGT